MKWGGTGILRAVILLGGLATVLPCLCGCHRAFVLRTSWTCYWEDSRCAPCLNDCDGEIGPACSPKTSACATRSSLRRAPCSRRYPAMLKAFGSPCLADEQGPSGPGLPPNWSDAGPTNFHPVPTRPVFGPQLAPGCQMRMNEAIGYPEMQQQGTHPAEMPPLRSNLKQSPDEGPATPGDNPTIPLRDIEDGVPKNDVMVPEGTGNELPAPSEFVPPPSDKPSDKPTDVDQLFNEDQDRETGAAATRNPPATRPVTTATWRPRRASLR